MIRIQTTPAESVDNSFRSPLNLMSDCHRRIEMFFARMLEVAKSAQGGPLSENRREALDTALRYFAAGAPMHTHDEEESLFPRLRAVGTPEAEAALAAVEKLESDHRAAEAAHAEIDDLGRRWLTHGTLPEADTVRFISMIEELRELYRKHIDVEDNQIFPLAGKVLGDEALEKIGREMATRRGLDFDRLPAVSRCAQRALDRQAAETI